MLWHIGPRLRHNDAVDYDMSLFSLAADLMMQSKTLQQNEHYYNSNLIV